MDKFTTVHTGIINKLESQHQQPVNYFLPLGAEKIPLNPLLGTTIRLSYQQHIFCIHCGRKIKKSFNQGYCFPCTQRLAACDLCIVKPELCHYAQGTCREPQWADQHCMLTHVVYLALTSGVKVGITRQSQIPTRWIDQGATLALPIYQVSNRLLAGLLEVTIATKIPDKTDWRRMLKYTPDHQDLLALRDRLWQEVHPKEQELLEKFGPHSVQKINLKESTPIQYPFRSLPEKIKALNFDTTAEIQGELLGIKGQYLLFDTGVLNMRKFAGYEIQLQHA